MAEAAGPETHDRPDGGLGSAGDREPVLVRGRLWHNTAEARRELPREQEAPGDLGTEDLVKRLGQANRTEARRSAAESLGRLGQVAAGAIPDLLECSVDIDATVREAALNALDAIEPGWHEDPRAQEAFPALVAALRSWSSDVSQAAFRRLGSIGLPAVPDLVNALPSGEDSVAHVREIHLLGQMGSGAASAVPELSRALGSSFVQVRIAAAEALACMGPLPVTTVLALMAGLVDQYADARRTMAACLACAGEAAESALPALLPLLADRDGRVRKAASAALEQAGPKAVPSLIEMVQSRDALRLKAWARSMIEVSQWKTLSEPDVAALDPVKAVRNLSWAAFDILEEQAAMEAAQEAAVHVLGRLGPAAIEAVPTLVQAMKDGNPAVRLAAIRSLGQIGPGAQAIPALTGVLERGSAPEREEAAKALAKILAAARPPKGADLSHE